MYKKTMIYLVAHIKNIIPSLEVFDANQDFKEPDNYASISILNLQASSPHENLIETYKNVNDATLKSFNYKETNYINVRVDFRGDKCHENIASFRSSFLLQSTRELLKEAGFGFLGFGVTNNISSLRDTKARLGMTTTLKLISSNTVVDDIQIIGNITVDVVQTISLK